MNRRAASLLFLLAAPATAFCQPTITHAEDFELGTRLQFQECAAARVLPGPAGAAQSWDFSSLTALPDTVTEWMVSPASTPFAASFPTATLVEKYSDSTYVFFYKTAADNYLVGYGDGNQSFEIAYPDPIRFAHRPLAYGDALADTFSTRYTAGGMAFRGAGTITLRADAYGTLTLPNGTFANTLRLVIRQVQSDTLTRFGTISQTYVSTYVWFDETHRSALLKMDSTAANGRVTRTVEYLLSETAAPAAVADGLPGPALTVYPNPAKAQAQVDVPAAGVLTLLNPLGQIVQEESVGPGRHVLPLSALASGVYQLQWRGRDSRRSARLVVE